MIDVILTIWLLCSFFLLVMITMGMKHMPEAFESLMEIPEPMRSIGGLIIILGGPITIIALMLPSSDDE